MFMHYTYIQHVFIVIYFILEILDILQDLKKTLYTIFIVQLTNTHVIYNTGMHVSLLCLYMTKYRVINDLKIR